MTFSFDFSNDKPSLRELIPSTVPLFVEMTYTPGGVDIPGTPQEQKTGALTQSNTTDALYLKSEFTVLRGPYKGRKFWSNLTVYGGKVDEKGASKGGKISRETIRSIIDSSVGLKSGDQSPEAAAKRVLPQGFRSLQARRFMCFSKVEKGKDGYADKNGLGQILTLDHAKYPKNEAELDNPQLGQQAAPALPAPTWVAPGAGGEPQVVTPAVAVVTPAATFVNPVPANQDNGLPKWAA